MLPYVLIRELFAAKSVNEEGVAFEFVGGITEISAPVSIKNDFLEFLS